MREKPVENFMFVCPFVLSEIECGLVTAAEPDLDKQRACREFITAQAMENTLEVRVSIRHSYTEIVSNILRKFPKASEKTKLQRHLSDIQVDINDIWIAAVALDHGLILLTGDHMEKIKQCAPELRCDNWLR